MEHYTIQPSDVGQVEITAYGRLWVARGFGKLIPRRPIQPSDVGRAVYLVPGKYSYPDSLSWEPGGRAEFYLVIAGT